MKKIIIGLGNPGPRYVFTRHNVGFLSIDRFYEINKKFIDFREVSGRTFEGYESSKYLLVKPTTFMNLSGQVFIELSRKYGRINNTDIVLIYDDVSLDFGKIRIRKTGSAGGHNGVKSIIASLGTQEFLRIRVGVDKKPEYMKLSDYVLSQFKNDELSVMNKILDPVSNIIEMLVDNKVDEAMNKYNGEVFL
ncbi:peptidyl-tRNA hydrolase [Tepiditoga spiralis]|uniref:Peptidyl-tRNA hydrolase n=1 Tax=Tepiditoga spiralis TaxID=2108365 RepID=A0A7G1G6L0_9BACT|nr:aminoacyl-tRNA hydrolase [Tepiditoga spiralis]BBE30473.1 peptidyl-tRNA hydrolase [Tepiditoga spiralis]